jgi:copper chaperone CopZ
MFLILYFNVYLEVMKKTEFNVKGMHCHSCETLVKDELMDMKGVKKVEADFKAGKVTVEADDVVDMNVLKSKIKELGYEVD